MVALAAVMAAVLLALAVVGTSWVSSSAPAGAAGATLSVKTREQTDSDSDSDSASGNESGGLTVKHVVLVLADDLGLNDLGVYNQEIEAITPTLTSLAEQGVVFSKYYSMHRCTPARSALLTGKQPYRLGMQVDNITPATPFALPRSDMIIPEFLREQGFKSHLVGKWNQGHLAEENMPHQRGFDSFFGYLTDEIDYYTHKYPNSFNGLHFKDYVRADASGYTYVDSDAFSMEDFMNEAVGVVKQHDPQENLFLYFASQAPHGPVVTAPASMLSTAQAAAIKAADPSSVRQDYLSLVASLDTSVAAIVNALKDKGMWEDTLLIFASDNGACSLQGGLNLPLRGGKSSLFEGGFHVPAFVHHTAWLQAAEAGTVPKLHSQQKILQTRPRPRGGADRDSGSNAGNDVRSTLRVYRRLFRVTDWLPSIMSAIGASDVVRSAQMHGKDHWDDLRALGTAPADTLREDFQDDVIGPLHEHTTEVLWYASYEVCCEDHSDKGSCHVCTSDNAFGAAINEGYKYIIQSGETDFWTEYPSAASYNPMDNCGDKVSSDGTQDFLFQLDDDITESTDMMDQDSATDTLASFQRVLNVAAENEAYPLFRADQNDAAVAAWRTSGFIGPYAEYVT